MLFWLYRYGLTLNNNRISGRLPNCTHHTHSGSWIAHNIPNRIFTKITSRRMCTSVQQRFVQLSGSDKNCAKNIFIYTFDWHDDYGLHDYKLESTLVDLGSNPTDQHLGPLHRSFPRWASLSAFWLKLASWYLVRDPLASLTLVPSIIWIHGHWSQTDSKLMLFKKYT